MSNFSIKMGGVLHFCSYSVQKMGVRFHCTPMPVLKMLHILYSCVNLCIVFDKKHSTMGKFPAKQLKLCGFLPHPHVNFYFALSPVIHFFLPFSQACPCVFLSTIPGVFCTGLLFSVAAQYKTPQLLKIKKV